MAATALKQEKTQKLTTEQKQAIRKDYAAAMRGEVTDARAALDKIRASHAF